MNLIPPFGNQLPVRIRFGEGVASSLPDVLAELGATRVFLMVDEGIEQFNPAAAVLLGSLASHAGLTITRFDKSPAEP
ncbi:MAG TPA: iron-containing alcohol dehydrogenase, partial [Acidimicrobiales bacterium]